MSFLKIIILLPSVWLFNMSFTSPNPAPAKSERLYGAFHKYISPRLYGFFYQFISASVLATLHGLWGSIPCIAELIVLFMIHFPSTLSSGILPHLVLTDQLPTSTVNLYLISGFILVAIGCFGRQWCFRTLGRQFTYEITIRKDHELVTSGPYKIVRHPSYLSVLLADVGISLIMASPGSFLRQCGWLDATLGTLFVWVWVVQTIAIWTSFYLRSQREDGLLQKQFQGEWDKYADRVRYRVIPGVY